VFLRHFLGQVEASQLHLHSSEHKVHGSKIPQIRSVLELLDVLGSKTRFEYCIFVITMAGHSG
jgi:hypothetical protein